MIRFALKNMAIKKVKVLLVALSVIVSASVALLAYNVSRQVEDGIVDTAGYYDIIIGPSGSSTQLAMNAMFFTDAPVGTIPYSLVEELAQSPSVNQVVPIAMGDSYNAARIIGTTAELLDGKALKGAMFEGTREAVVGASVAARYGLNIGDQIISSHGLTGSGSAHGDSPFTITGILEKTYTAYDNVVFASIESIWESHSHSDEDEHGDEDHDEDEGDICAILIRTKSFSDYYTISNHYGADSSLLVINPATVLREVLSNVDLSSRIVYILCGIILAMNVIVITVITLLNMYDAKREIALMRLIGIGMDKIALLYLIQNCLIGLVSTALSLALSHLCLILMGDFVSSMGIVLNAGAVYPLEWAIIALVFVISVLPTAIYIAALSRKDGLDIK